MQRPLLDDFANVAAKDEADKEEELLEKAIETVRAEGKASVSLLQRRLRIGYARAARLIDEMEAQGIIGADQGGGRARPILVTQADDDADPTADDDDDDDYDEEYDA